MNRYRLFAGFILLVAAGLLLAACGAKPSASPTATAVPPTANPPTAVPPTAIPTPASPFNYDASVPFDIKIISQTEQDGATVTELSYAAHDPSFAPTMGGRTVATLVSPKGDGPFAGIMWIHGAGSDHHVTYLDEAVTLASHGTVSLLPAGYFPWSAAPTGTQADQASITGQVIELRRAFDFLLAQPGVDPQRLGFVGQGWGSTYGGILAGVDQRAKTYVYIMGQPTIMNMMKGLGFPKDQYGAIVKDLNPINFVPNAAPASLFFQFWKNDGEANISLDNQYYAAASQPKQIEWYENIDMKADPVVKARQGWLIGQLNLAP